MWRGLAGAALALALSATAGAQEAPRARLLTVPDGQALSDLFPVAALARGVSGRVVLSCDVTTDGSSDCSAAEETPVGMGFGAAAEALAADWTFTPVAGVVRVPIEFQNEITSPVPIQAGLYVTQIAADPSIGEIEPGAIIVSMCRLPGCPAPVPRPTTTYPPAAIGDSVAGRALVACALRSSGARECVIENESPSAFGFGEAALALVTDIDGQANEVFRVPVQFSRAGQRNELWARRPDSRRYGRIYPESAIRRGLDGRVDVLCSIQSDGRLACDEALEQPRNSRFATAAIALMEEYQLNETSLGLPGLAVGDRITMSLAFDMQD